MPDEPKPTLGNMQGVKSRLHEQDEPGTLPVGSFAHLNIPTLAEVRGIIPKRNPPNRTAHTVMVTFRAPHEMDRRLTALAKARRTTKTALLLDAAEALLNEGEGEVPGERHE
jgi:hypothetical protein